MSSVQISNNETDETGEVIEPDNLLKCGIDTIYNSFTSNAGNYIEQIKEQKKIINDLSQKIELMKEELEMIVRENQYYKTQNEKLKNEIDNLNKIVNNIKGKLTKFDFKINNKKIIENINQENMNDKNIERIDNTNFKNYFKKSVYPVNYSKYENRNSNYNRDKSLQNLELNKNSKTFRYTKHFNLDDLSNSKIYKINNNLVNMDNLANLNNEENLNNDKYKSNFNIDDYNKISHLNEYKNMTKNQKQAHNSIYNLVKNKIVESHDLSNILNPNKKGTKIKKRDKTYNIDNIKLMKQANISSDISAPITLVNKYDNNHHDDKNDIFIQKKISEKNKKRSNSSNSVVLKDIMNNEKLKIKSYAKRNNGKDNSLQIFNSSPYMQGVDNDEYRKQVCQTYQNIDKINNDENGNNCLKELKMKEMTFFIKKCKLYLDQITFEKIMKIFQEYKNGIITDEGIIKKINHYLKNNTELLNLFKNIIL